MRSQRYELEGQTAPYLDVGNNAPSVGSAPASLSPADRTADNLITLISELQKVDLNAPLAKLNETTISDNNGGRIEL